MIGLSHINTEVNIVSGCRNWNWEFSVQYESQQAQANSPQFEPNTELTAEYLMFFFPFYLYSYVTIIQSKMELSGLMRRKR